MEFYNRIHRKYAESKAQQYILMLKVLVYDRQKHWKGRIFRHFGKNTDLNWPLRQTRTHCLGAIDYVFV